jgi:hypothetical protein
LVDGLTIFCVHLFQNLDLHGLISHQPFQPAVLLLHRPQSPGLADVHPAILGTPFVKRPLTDVMPGAHGAHRRVAFGLPENPDDLFFAEFALFHSSAAFLFEAELHLCHVHLFGVRST